MRKSANLVEKLVRRQADKTEEVARLLRGMLVPYLPKEIISRPQKKVNKPPQAVPLSELLDEK